MNTITKKYLIRYEYRGISPHSNYYSDCRYDSLYEIADRLELLENSVKTSDIESIKITLQTTPVVFWLEMRYDKQDGFITNLMINDYVIGELFTLRDVFLFLKSVKGLNA